MPLGSEGNCSITVFLIKEFVETARKENTLREFLHLMQNKFRQIKPASAFINSINSISKVRSLFINSCFTLYEFQTFIIL